MIGSQLNHYKIISKLGTGGMGEVYAAEDTKLNRKVAIKVLPEDLAADPERRERFEREATTIAALNHPNIVTIYSVEESDGLHFITMELVQGSTLKEKIPAGGLTLDEFFKLSVPMVDAIDAAHKQGITHRDIKPHNVMVTEEGRVKVLDFGLAKLTGKESPLDPTEAATMVASSDLTEQGQILGTVNYMSPEQAEGKTVDNRSDIFSAGAVMYEMATGEAPFKGETKVSVITSIMRDTPPPVSEVNAELPQHLGRVVNRSLAKDPGRRYQSATDLRVELESLKEEIATSELRQSAMSIEPPPPERGPMGQWLAGAAAVIAVVAMAAVFGPGLMGGGDASAPSASPVAADATPSLAVLYFENLSNDENLDWLRTGLTDMLVTDLAQSPNLRVLGTDRLHQILEDIGAADEEMTSASVVDAVAREGQVANVLLGSFARAGDAIRISARLQVAGSGEILSSETVAGEGEESIFELVDDLTRRIKSQFDMPEAMVVADVDADLASVTTDSMEAYRYYAEGIMLHEQLRTEEAIPLLEQAVEIDPDFAMALAKLATAYNNAGNMAKSREYSQRAMDNRERATPRERYYIEGRHYSLDQETIEESIAAYTRAIEAYPDHTSARNNLAQQLMALERYDEAIDHLEDLRRRGMRFPGTFSSLATSYGMVGRFDDGMRVLREYVEQNPDNAAGHRNLAGHLLWAGRFDEAAAALDRAEAAGSSAFDVNTMRWQSAALQNDWDEAENVAEILQELEDPRGVGSALFSQAFQALFEGDPDAAFDVLDEIHELPGGDFENQVFDSRANLHLDLGDYDAALATGREMEASADGDFDLMIGGKGNQALAYAGMGDRLASNEIIIEMFELVAGVSLPARIIQRQERMFRGRVAFQARDWEEVIELLEPLLERMPPMERLGNSQRTRLQYIIGVAYHQSGREDDAAAAFLNGLEQSGRIYDPVATVRSLWRLGSIYEERGDAPRAREYYQRFVDHWGRGDIDEDNVAHAEDFLER